MDSIRQEYQFRRFDTSRAKASRILVEHETFLQELTFNYCRAVCSTISMADNLVFKGTLRNGRKHMHQLANFDVCVVVDANMVNEPQCCLTVLHQDPEQLILAGDTNHKSPEISISRRSQIFYLRTSFMTRYARSGFPILQLGGDDV